MTDSNARRLSPGAKVVLVIAIFLVVSIFVPAKLWDSKITSGRYVSEAVITQVGSDSIVAVISGTHTSLTMKGRIPDYAEVGQSIRIGYSRDGLFADTSQKVEVAYYYDGTLFNKIIHTVLGSILGSARKTSDDLKITNVKSDGSLLRYYRAA